MAEPLIPATLKRKRAEIEAVISDYEARIADAKRDLAHVDAALRLFDPKIEGTERFPVYFELGRLWRRGEIVSVCREALEREGPLTTLELAERVMATKGLREADYGARLSVSHRVGRALSNAAKRGTIGNGGKRKGVRVWENFAS